MRDTPSSQPFPGGYSLNGEIPRGDTIKMTSAFSKIEHVNTRLAEFAYEQVFNAIVAGQLIAGDRLIQEKLAEDLDISRTPVREALLRLEQEGVVVHSGRRGFIVRDISEQEIRDVYQAREAIEGYGARVAATTCTDEDLDRIRELSQPAHHNTVEAAFRANEALHRAIVEATGNKYLVELFNSVWTRSVGLRLYADIFAQDGFTPHVADDHAPVLEALAAGDGEAAEAAMVSHIRAGCEIQVTARRKRQAAGAKGPKITVDGSTA